jgi:hypothetical protein
MSWTSTIPVTIALSWMLTPEVLVRLGNGVGEGGLPFLALLAGAALVSGLAVYIIRQPGLRTGHGYDPTVVLLRGLGRLPAAVLTAGRLSLAVLLPTSLLVSAGYTFNEVFISWFPNFGFSFILLAGIVLLHLAGERTAEAMQPVFVATAIGSLLLLVPAGWVLWWSAATAPEPVRPPLTLATALSPLLLFLGYDTPSPGDRDQRRPALLAIAIGAVLFLALGLVALHTVTAGRLAESTLPHMLIAREIAGQPGRMLMGGAVIAGVAGAVNGLFLMTGRSLADLADHGLLPGIASRPVMMRVYPILFAGLIGLCLMTGLAGHDILGDLIEAALLLWLVHVAGLCFAAGRITAKSDLPVSPPPLLASGLGLLVLSFCLILAVTHGQALVFICFYGAILAFALLLSAIWPANIPEEQLNSGRNSNP